MFCPLCGLERRDGLNWCMDCNVSLMGTPLPEPEPEYTELSTVFQGDSATATVARTVVEGAGIESWIRDEEVHGLFPSLGPTEVLVSEEDESKALKALAMPNQRPRTVEAKVHSALSRSRTDGKSQNGGATKETANLMRGQNEVSEKGQHTRVHRHQGKCV